MAFAHGREERCTHTRQYECNEEHANQRGHWKESHCVVVGGGDDDDVVVVVRCHFGSVVEVVGVLGLRWRWMAVPWQLAGRRCPGCRNSYKIVR